VCGGWGRLRRRTQQHAACKATDSKHSPHPDSCNPQPSQQSLQSAAQGKHTLAARNQWLSPPHPAFRRLEPRPAAQTAATQLSTLNSTSARSQTCELAGPRPEPAASKPAVEIKSARRCFTISIGSQLDGDSLAQPSQLAARRRWTARSDHTMARLSPSSPQLDGASHTQLARFAARRCIFAARQLDRLKTQTSQRLTHLQHVSSIRRSPLET